MAGSRQSGAIAGGTSPVVLYLYVENVDETVARAEVAGAKTLVAPTNQFGGDRTAWIMDPSGHVWTIAAPRTRNA